MTLRELIQQKCPTSICSSAGSHARATLYAEQDEALPIPGELYSLSLPELSKKNDLQLFCLKMFLMYSCT